MVKFGQECEPAVREATLQMQLCLTTRQAISEPRLTMGSSAKAQAPNLAFAYFPNGNRAESPTRPCDRSTR